MEYLNTYNCLCHCDSQDSSKYHPLSHSKFLKDDKKYIHINLIYNTIHFDDKE